MHHDPARGIVAKVHGGNEQEWVGDGGPGLALASHDQPTLTMLALAFLIELTS